MNEALSSDDDNNDLDRPSALLPTQRYIKSGTKDVKTIQSNNKQSTSPNDHDNKENINRDDETLSNKQSKPQYSPTTSDKSPSPKHSNRSREGIDQSENDDDHLSKQIKRHDLIQTSSKDTNWNIVLHPFSPNQSDFADKKETKSVRHSSYGKNQNAIIPSLTNQKSQTKSNKTSAIHTPSTLDTVASSNKAVATSLQPSTRPHPFVKLPSRLKAKLNPITTIEDIHKKEKPKIPSRYKDITARVDVGQTPVASMDLSQSIERAVDKALKSQITRVKKQSVSNHNSEYPQSELPSIYNHIQARVNSNPLINFDELNTSQIQTNSSPSSKGGVYLEWLKTKEEQKKLEREKLKRRQEEIVKSIDKSALERKIYQDAQNLERWRQEKTEQMKQKRQEELELKREQEENEIRELEQKQKNAIDGFDDWKTKKVEELKQKIEANRNKRIEIEKQQEAKQKETFKAAEAYYKWMAKKTNQTKKTVRDEGLKKARENEQTKFVRGQQAYEQWVKNKDKYEIEKAKEHRRNPLSIQEQPPFLLGAQNNTGKVIHVFW